MGSPACPRPCPRRRLSQAVSVGVSYSFSSSAGSSSRSCPSSAAGRRPAPCRGWPGDGDRHPAGPVLVLVLAPVAAGGPGDPGCGWGPGAWQPAHHASIQGRQRLSGDLVARCGSGLVVGVAVLTQKAVPPLGHALRRGHEPRWIWEGRWEAQIEAERMSCSLTDAAALAVGVEACWPGHHFLQDVTRSSRALAVYLLAGLGIARLIGDPLGAVGHGPLGEFRVIAHWP